MFMFSISLVFIIMGVILLAVAFGKKKKIDSFKKASADTAGTVIEKHDDGMTGYYYVYTVRVEYSVNDAIYKQWLQVTPAECEGLSVGSTVAVRYKVSDPGDAVLSSHMSTRVSPAYTISGAVFMIAGIVLHFVIG